MATISKRQRKVKVGKLAKPTKKLSIKQQKNIKGGTKSNTVGGAGRNTVGGAV